MKRYFLLTCLSLNWATGQTLTDRELGSLLETHLAQSKLPALGAAAFTDTKTLGLAVRGVRKAEGNTPATIEDRWHLGSNTKSMTASLAAILIHQGKLSWQTSIGETFPKVHPKFASVTLQQLMEHRAGMSHDGHLWKQFTSKPGSPRETRHWWVTENLLLPPTKSLGSYEYSNLGFATAGAMLESTLHQDWETLVQAQLWKPLGITTGGFGMPAKLGKTDQPWGHNEHGQPIPPGPLADNPAGLGPAGTAHMALADYVKYAQWHLTEGRSAPGLLPPDAFKIMHTTQAPNTKPGSDYEAGWMIVPRPWAGGAALTHAGTNTMNYCIVWLAPVKHFGFVLVTNQGGEKAGQALDQLAGALVGKLSRTPE